MPLPTGPSGAYSGVWGWGLGVKKTSKNQEAIIAAIAYYLQSKTSRIC